VKFPDGIADLAPGYIGAWAWVTGPSVSLQNTVLPSLFDDVRIYNRDLSPEEIALIASGNDFNTCPPPDAGHPPLSVARVPAGVRVSWPSRYTGWALEKSLNLNSWTPMPGTPAIEGSEFFVPSSAAPSAEFFRLRRSR
jgi:hypothetical protein